MAKEIQLGRIVGPFDGQPFPVFHASPLGLIPKKVPGEFRLIHHLSFPEGKSINSHIPQIASSVHYANIDDAIRLIWRTGRGCALAKTDIKNVFRLILVSPSDYNLLRICWRDRFYVDRNLAMGLSSSCKIFECFSSALESIDRFRLHIPGMLHLLDDFLIVKSLQSLIGLLNFTCSVIVPGRTFLCLINLTVGVKCPRYFIRLNQGTKSDLKLRLTFLESYNTKSFFMLNHHALRAPLNNCFGFVDGTVRPISRPRHA